MTQIVIAWTPFRLDAPRPISNGAEFADAGTLALSGGPARAIADAPLPWNEADNLTVDLTVRTDHPEQQGPARILTISRDHQHSNLVIGQEYAELVVRVREPGSGGTEVRLPGVFESPGWRRIRVEIDDMARVIVDDRVLASQELQGSAFTAWAPTYRIALGDEPIGERPWQGLVREARITAGSEAYDLISSNILDVPARFIYIPVRLHDVLGIPTASALVHTALHFVMWIPAGLILATGMPTRRRVRRVATVAAGLALLLQIVKIIIFSRHPSLLDAATQTSGAIVGALLASALRTPRLTPANSHRSGTFKQ